MMRTPARLVMERFVMGLLMMGLLVMGPLAMGARVHAQAVTGERAQREARETFERGMQELQAGRYRDATLSFERSFELAPRLPTAFNWALALRGMGRALEAERLYQRVLDGDLGTLRAQDRAAVTELLAEVRAGIAELRMTIEGPEELEVRLDGIVLASRPGVHVVRVDPGERVIVVSARDHETLERRVQASGAPLELTVTLREAHDARPGTLVLRSNDTEARFTVLAEGEEEPRATGPSPWSGQLAPGRYVIVTRGAHGERRTEIEVPAGRQVALALEPPERPIVEEPWFWVVIGVGAAAIVGGVVAISYTERAEPPFTNEVFPPIYALTF